VSRAGTPQAVGAAGWTVREAVPADEPAQAAIFNTCFRKDKDATTFEWKYRDNPDGPAIGRVAIDAEGRVVGSYSYVPRRFLRDGQPVALMQASDAMTLPEWQGRGIFTGLDDVVAQAAGAAGYPLCFAYSGRLSLKGFLRNGWQLIGHAPLWRRSFQSRRALLRKGRVGPLLLPAAPVLDLVAGLRDRARLALPGGEAGLQRLARFDERVDRLFQRCAPRTGLVGVRSAAWLNWRYVDTPGRRQECWGLLRGDELLGYVVAELQGGNAFLADHLAADEPARAALMLGFTALARERGQEEASALLFDHNPAVQPLVGLGYRRGRTNREFRDIFPFIVRRCRADASETDLQMTRWHLADGDRDAEHLSP
jgi:hypothetical protein